MSDFYPDPLPDPQYFRDPHGRFRTASEEELLARVENQIAKRRQIVLETVSKEKNAKQEREAEKQVDDLMRVAGRKIRGNLDGILQIYENSGRSIEDALGNVSYLIENTTKELNSQFGAYFTKSRQEMEDLFKKQRKIGFDKLNAEEQAVIQSARQIGIEEILSSNNAQSARSGELVSGGIGGLTAAGIFGRFGKGGGDAATKLSIHGILAKVPGLRFIPGASSLIEKIFGGDLGTIIGRVLPAAATIEALDQGVNFYRQTTQAGRLTGEGFGAGLGATLHAIRQGINPFDLVTTEMAQQIINSVRSQGFRDRTADLMANAVGDIINRFGTDMQATIDILTTGTRGITQAQGGMPVTQAMNQMKASLAGLSDAVKQAGISTQQATTDIQQYLNQYPSFGPGAALLANASNAAYRIKSIGGVDINSYLAQNLKFLTIFGGGQPQVVGLPESVPAVTLGTARVASLLASEYESVRDTMSKSEFANFVWQNNILGLGSFKSASQVEQFIFGPGSRTSTNNLTAFKTKGIFAHAQQAMRDEIRRIPPLSAQGVRLSSRIGGNYTPINAQIAGERQYIKALRNSLIGQGILSEAQVNQLLRPLVHSIGNEAQFNQIIRGTSQARPLEIKVKLEMDRNAKRLFSARYMGYAQNYENSLYGAPTVPGSMLNGGGVLP